IPDELIRFHWQYNPSHSERPENKHILSAYACRVEVSIDHWKADEALALVKRIHTITKGNMSITSVIRALRKLHIGRRVYGQTDSFKWIPRRYRDHERAYLQAKELIAC
ncbi:MAG: hypothetical protein ACYTEQ_31125, partial [Planctomycetota bacterium]